MLGALDKNGKYTLPETAVLNQQKEREKQKQKGEQKGEQKEKDEYTCPDCKEKVILKNGEIKRPHFSHLPQSAHNCDYYERESLQHYLAKHLLKYFLDQNFTIKLNLRCHNYIDALDRCCDLFYTINIKKEDSDTVISEYSSDESKERYDLAIVSRNKYNKDILDIKYIFEIKHTHSIESRPEPWYEVEASEVLNYSNLLNVHLVEEMVEFLSSPSTFCSSLTNNTKKIIELNCVRNFISEKENEEERICHCCRAKDEDWVTRIPKLNNYKNSKNSKNEKECICCGKEKYYPIFSKGYRSVCKICMNNSYQEVKNMAYLNF